jgi:hypothetical protein
VRVVALNQTFTSATQQFTTIAQLVNPNPPPIVYPCRFTRCR